ncbi:hypothetical protein APHAL10511_001507 [Amanita phalloides]|nr:hypothetical protein APHAL10511_001507 [Amanita phalloides]
MSPSAPAYLSRIPPKCAELQETWPYLRDGLERIMTHMPGDEMSFTAYTNLYTTIYNFFKSASISSTFELYNNIGTLFAKHLEQIGQHSESLHGVDLLRYYSEQWERYTNNATYANRLFIIMNRSWIKQVGDFEKMRDAEKRDAEKKTIYPIYTLALMQWKQCIFIPVQQNLINALLGLIMQDRDGAPIDQALIKTVVDSLVSLGVDDNNLYKKCLEVYVDFKAPFMIETERYYKKESETILAKNSISEYLRKAEDRLREEEDRVGRYLHPSTRPGLIVLCERVLIKEHAQVIRDSFQSLLDGDKYEDLGRMHALLSRVPGELEPLRNRFEAHVKQVAPFSASLDEAYQELANRRVATDVSTGSS